MWHHRVGSTPDAPAMRYRDGEMWRTMTWADAGKRVQALANALLARGLASEHRCIVWAKTSVEWILADMAILCAGGATTAVYPSATDDQLVYIAKDCDARFLFVDTLEQLARLQALRSRLPGVEGVVLLGDGQPPEDPWITSLASFEREGRDHGAAHPEDYERAHQAIESDHLATLLYTSGTTGRPKGVMLTHDAWVFEAEAIDALGVVDPTDLQFLWMPLAHVFAKVLQLSFVRLGIPTVVDRDQHTLFRNLQQCRPTFFALPPRTLEHLRRHLEQSVRQQGTASWRAYRWALALGVRRADLIRAKRAVPAALQAQWALADRWVFAPLRKQLGGRIRFIICGSAPLADPLAVYFHAIGLPVLQGYGLTESAAASCVQRPDDVQIGTVGPPLPGCEVRIAEDGEILLRSRGVMRGYLGDRAGTAAALTEDGFLRTGDIGLVLPDGHVKITGRKKEIIVTSTGKNVAPTHVEQLLLTHCPLLEHVVLFGDGHPYCTALATLDLAAVRSWAERRQLELGSELADDEEVLRRVQRSVDAVNRDLPRYERIRGIQLLQTPFTQDNGLLTASGKISRADVRHRFSTVMDALYDGTDEAKISGSRR
ncbi:MAG: long-chain fatty acid--CoA ligase [Myxococcales bacterium]|nr:long-chain fatty acid--CoA ligase [Myxococcales bacterium]